MTSLTIPEIIEIHERQIAEHGGSPGIKNLGLLESAFFGCYQTFGSVELYPSITEKAARMAFAIGKNHPFNDGNKRVAVATMLITLRINGIYLSFTQQELITLGLGIADGSLKYDDILAWIKAHTPAN